ncbi:hypothetical protein HRK28_00545 [Rathayibacter sp. VKM Ac-2835]|uniref:hypothetical protein n=1 Tax=Rathayibacter sp. VKM Ac-2835 TaxID=2739043 RepID=UPI0015665336|nr:hypothetical protein [Rathayibacter sp. VKM Ac-2835]NRG39401.1 hypothetical protein [Rathayibacter sp. VKM Ac-2835]
MAASGERNGSGERSTERIAGFAVAGAGALGALVHDGDGRRLNAALLSRERAEAALRSGLDRLGRHDHRQRLVDVGVHRDGLVLLTEPPVVTTLEEVLESDVALPPGVVVTLLAPIIGALRDCMAAGVLPAPGAEAIGLTEEGRPVLLLSEAAAAASEYEVRSAVRGLLARCRQRCPEWHGSPGEDDDLEAVEALLYRTAVPLPLGASPRVARAAEGLERAREVSPGRHRRTHPLDGWRDRAIAVVVRRRGPLAAALVILVGALAMTAWGPERVSGAQSAAQERPPVATPLTPAPLTPSPTATPSPAPAPTPSPAAASPRTPSPESAPAVQPPPADLGAEAAAVALLAAVRDCRAASRACASALTTTDSPLRSEWAAVAVSLRHETAVTAVHADVNGASAVVAIGPDPGTTTASVLMIRTEAVWLLRDVFTDGGR